MPRVITIWTQPGCPECEKAKAHFLSEGCQVVEKSVLLENLMQEPEEIRDTVMADLQMQDGALPLVYEGGERIKSE